MKELPVSIKKAVRRYEAIEVAGLTLYPVKVKDFDEFRLAVPALEALQQSFPVALMSVPFLQAAYQMDCEAVARRETAPGLFASAILGLSLALRLGEGEELEGRLRQFDVETDPKRPERLKRLRALRNGEEIIEITPAQYARLRPIIAAQNGVKLYGDDANPELVAAERAMQSQGPPLTGGIEEEKDFVNLLTPEDLDEWPILKLQNKAEAMRRALDYVVCGINEGAGCRWKGGNPAPHPFLRRKESGSGAVVEANSILNGAIEKAARTADGQITI